jgi:hypothetical protein
MSITRLCAIAAVLMPAFAVAAAPNDMRDLRIGSAVATLPAGGYGGFTCRDDPSIQLPDWQAWRTCPASTDNTRAVSFRFDNPVGKTEVAGQPVKLALLIDNEATVTGIRIETDPNARLYQHKKAFLFALQVRARYGEDGWTCSQQSPTAAEQPVGGVFIHEHCEKTTASRHLLLDRELFRDPAKDLRDFTNGTQLTILQSDRVGEKTAAGTKD